MSDTEPQLDDFIKWVEKLVYRYGVELDIYAWRKVKEKIRQDDFEDQLLKVHRHASDMLYEGSNLKYGCTEIMSTIEKLMGE